jgi:methionyl-tRNA formyltransferase
MNHVNNLKIVFFGTPEFAIPSLQSLIKADFNVVAVVTQPDKPVGRKQTITSPPVKNLAQKYNIPTWQPEKITPPYDPLLKKGGVDLFVIVAYGKILPQSLLDIPKHGSINIHPSLLPLYRGPAPLQNQILDNVTETGVSIMLIDEEMDHGPVLKNYELRIKNYEDYNYETLGRELFELGAKHLPETIIKYIKSEIKPQVQDHTKATFTKLIKKEDGQIDWHKPADYIERMTRAYSPWPSAYAKLKMKNEKLKTKEDLLIKIIKARVNKEKSKLLPGTIFKSLNCELAVACGQGSTLIIEELQSAGKQKMTAQDFLRGHSLV